MSEQRSVRVLCPNDCGRALKIIDPGGSPWLGSKTPPNNLATRWVRRRTVRIRFWLHDYRYGRDIKEALLAHYMLQCSQGLAADEDCAADCLYCTESTYRCDRERGHDGDHEEHDEQDNLLHNWRNESGVVETQQALEAK